MKYHLVAPVPPIDTIDDLAELLGVSSAHIARCANSSKSFYRSYQIPKSSGETRTINAPTPSLLMLQKEIRKRILLCIECSDQAHGFVSGRSIITHVSNHSGGKEFLVADLKDFFPTIKLPVVINIFQQIGFNHKISTLLSLICTLHEELPQGAPTSPYLSNIACLQLDRRLAQFAEQSGLIYSRYADDLVFSGHHVSLPLRDHVASIVEEEGFLLNEKKTLLATNQGKIIITGISLSRGRLCLPRDAKRKLRKQAHFMMVNGIVSESSYSGRFDPLYVDRILGRLGFWMQVEPENMFAKKAKLAIMAQLSHFK